MKALTREINAAEPKRSPLDKKPTIVRLNPDLKKKLKHLGIEQDKSLNTLIEEAIEAYLKAHQD
jgi:predicted HicB family RNase H-like nuclease